MPKPTSIWPLTETMTYLAVTQKLFQMRASLSSSR